MESNLNAQELIGVLKETYSKEVQKVLTSLDKIPKFSLE